VVRLALRSCRRRSHATNAYCPAKPLDRPTADGEEDDDGSESEEEEAALHANKTP
jgi:hypothetical protein